MMERVLSPLLVGLVVWSLSMTTEAAPTRAIYYIDQDDIKRADPDGSNPVTLVDNIGNGVGGLKVDGANGHLYWTQNRLIYRSNIDGTGTAEFYTEENFSFRSYAVDPARQKLIYARDRAGVYEVDLVSSVTTPIFEAVDPREIIDPRLHYDPDTQIVRWSDAMGNLKTATANGPPTTESMPIRSHTPTQDGGYSTDMHYGPEGPIPYTLGRATSGAVAVVGGLDGNDEVPLALTDMFGLPPMDIAADPDGGYIYYSGMFRAQPSGYRPGIARSRLDGSEFVKIVDTSGFGSIALDIADIDDTTDPVVTIFSPIGGTTNNQMLSIIGNVTDDSALTEVTWSHDGVVQAVVAVFNGDFTVPAVELHPGENVLEVTATDLVGNTGSAQVTLTWQPVRAVTLETEATVREGRRVNVDVKLDSPGDVAGMTFTLQYDPEFFESPKAEAGDVISGSSPTINTAVSGEVTLTFANAGVAVPGGEQVLLSTRLRARSVPELTTTEIAISIQDMADVGGNPINLGTFAGDATIDIIPRVIIGDVNSNDRLDTGDSSQMQSMLAGISETREWDHTANDLNGSSTLDSGDVIRVLRTVVGIDPQPSPPSPDGRTPRANGVPTGPDPEGPRLRLDLSQDGVPEGSFAVEAVVEGIVDPFSGASFTLDYPPEALRLENGASHTPGAVVGGDAFLLWNLAPSQNDYENQAGSITFGASSSADWPGSTGGGVLARFVFTIEAGADAQPVWTIAARDAELATDSGFEIVPLAGDTGLFIPGAQDYADWVAENAIDPALSDWTDDADADGATNGEEFHAGTDPNDPTSKPEIGAELVEAADGLTHCILLTHTRSLAAQNVEATLQASTDLATWTEVTDAVTSGMIDEVAGTETIMVFVDPIDLAVPTYYRFAIVDLSLP